MKPERVQLFQRLNDGARSVASQIEDVLDWIEGTVSVLRNLFGNRNNDS